MDRPLSGIQIVELAQYISGPYCGLLLSGLGADVTKIEPPDSGDLSRRCGPFPPDGPEGDSSGLFLYLNRNKRGVTLNIRTKTGRDLLLNLLRETDVFVEDMPPQLADDLGLDYEHLRPENPRLIVASITPFGQTGPYRNYKGYAINTSGLGGISSIIGDPKREPLTPPFSLGHFQTGVIAANAVLFALMARRRYGKGQHLDIAEAESWAIFHTGNVVSSFVYSGRKRNRTGHRTPGPYPYTILPCKDGYLSMIALRGSEWKRFLQIVGDGDVPRWYAEDERFQDRLQAGLHHADVLDELLSPWLMAHTREEIFLRCRQEHVPFMPVRNMSEVVRCQHLNERGYFTTVTDRKNRTFQCPGPPVRFSRSMWKVDRPAPRLAEHNREIYCDRLGYSEKELAGWCRFGIV